MKSKSLRANLFYQLIYQGLVLFYPLLTTPLISRAFGSETLGLYSYTYSIAYYFSLAAILGLGNYGSRMAAIYRDDKKTLRNIFWKLYSIQLLCSVLTIIVYIFYVVAFEKAYYKAAMLQGIMIVASMFDITWFLSGLEEFRSMVLRNSFIKISSLILIFKLVHEKSDLYAYIIIMTGTLALGQLSMWPTVIRIIGRPFFSWNGVKKHFFPVLSLFLPVVATNAYTVIDKTFLGVFRTMQEVGYYENSDKLVRMPTGLVVAACVVLLPRASYFISHGDKEKSDEYVVNTLSITLVIIVPVAIGLAAIAPQIVPWYLGNDFLPCVDYIRFLCPIIVAMSVSTILRMQYFVPNNLDREYTTSTIIGAVTNLLINAALVTRFGIYGVIIGSVLSEIISMIYLFHKASRQLKFISVLGIGIYSVLACIPMVCVVQYIGERFGAKIVTNILQMVVGGAVYGVIMAGFYFYVKYVKTKEECS